MLSLGKMAARTGVPKDELREMIMGGQIQGSRVEGRTAPWMIPESEVEKVKELKGPELERRSKIFSNRQYKKIAPADFGLDEDWITYSEAAKHTGMHRDSIHKRVKAGTLEYKIVQHGKRKVHFVRRSALEPRGPQAPKTEKAPPPDASGKMITILEAATRKGCATSTIYNYIKKGLLPYQKVRTGLKSFAYYVDSAAWDKLEVRTNTRTHKPASINTERGQVSAAPLIEKTDGPTLTERLLELAALVRGGGYEVTRLDVGVRVTGGE